MGLGSRRAVESWVAAGRITINGKPAKLGDHVGPRDRVALDGKTVMLKAPAVADSAKVIAYHKPEGEVCTRSDPEGRPTVFERLPSLHGERWISVGRLDINTSGLLLLTADGELAHRLMHPSREVEREYAVRVFGRIELPMLQRLMDGVQLDDGPARFRSLREAGGEGNNRWFHVVLTEGRQREVRRLWESQGCKVARLTRVRFGPVVLPRSLRRGRWQALTPEEVSALYEMVGLTPPSAEKPEPRHKRAPRAGAPRKPPTKASTPRKSMSAKPAAAGKARPKRASKPASGRAS